MGKSLSVTVLVIFSSLVALADPKSDLENQVVADIGQRVQQFKTPDEILAKLKALLPEADAKYLATLIEAKKWVELPTAVKTEKKVLTLEFPNNLSLAVEVTNVWTGELKLNDYPLSLNQYESVEEQVSYLRRVVKSRLLVDKKPGQGALLFSLLFPFAHASLTCNALISSGCVEVSVAATLWFVKTVSAESPIARCRDIYYYNKYDNVTAACVQKYKNNPTLTTIQELSEVMAGAPKASVKISCGRGEGPSIWIGGSEVTKLGRGRTASDYSVAHNQDSQGKLRKLPALAIKCCKQRSDDPLAGQCEEFVANHLGSASKRRSAFKDPNLRIRGEALPGVR